MWSDRARKVARRLAKVELLHWQAGPSLVPTPELVRSEPRQKAELLGQVLGSVAASDHVLRLRRGKSFCVSRRRSLPRASFNTWATLPCKGAMAYSNALPPAVSGLATVPRRPPQGRRRPQNNEEGLITAAKRRRLVAALTVEAKDIEAHEQLELRGLLLHALKALPREVVTAEVWARDRLPFPVHDSHLTAFGGATRGVSSAEVLPATAW